MYEVNVVHKMYEVNVSKAKQIHVIVRFKTN